MRIYTCLKLSDGNAEGEMHELKGSFYRVAFTKDKNIVDISSIFRDDTIEIGRVQLDTVFVESIVADSVMEILEGNYKKELRSLSYFINVDNRNSTCFGFKRSYSAYEFRRWSFEAVALSEVCKPYSVVSREIEKQKYKDVEFEIYSDGLNFAPVNDELYYTTVYEYLLTSHIDVTWLDKTSFVLAFKNYVVSYKCTEGFEGVLKTLGFSLKLRYKKQGYKVLFGQK